jgi:hypothetical protein
MGNRDSLFGSRESHKGRYFENRLVIVEFFASMRPNPDLTPDPFPKKEGEYAHKSSYFENTYP